MSFVPLDAADAKSFLGREADVHAVLYGLARSRFVLVLGPGGAGKTRLARFLLRGRPPSKAIFCDLSEARTKADVVGVVAAAIDVAPGSGDADGAAIEIGRALGALSDALIVLDNLETIGPGVEAIRAWIGSGPTFLGTSRVRLGLPGELDVELGPLSPDAALALFVERARVVAPELRPDAATRALVERLEGSPLAIELAAARAHVLSPRALLDRFNHHIDLLRSTARALPERHRSLRAVVEGSWELCSEADRVALAAASIFRGGFDLDGAEAVLGDGALDSIESLLASSLMQRASSASTTRFALYESVRELAAEKLAADPTRHAEIRARHADYFRRMAVRFAEGMMNAEPAALALVTVEAENFLASFKADPRSALAFNAVLHRALPGDAHAELLRVMLDTVADTEVATRAEIVLSLARAERRRGNAERALAHADAGAALAALAGAPEIVVDATYVAALMRFDVGRVAEAEAGALEAIAIAKANGAHSTIARCLDLLGWIAIDRGDFAEASRRAEEALAIVREHGFALLETFTENLLGAVHGRKGELEQADAHLARGLGLSRAIGNRWQEAILLGNLAKVSLLRGDLALARERVDAALAIARRIGARKSEVTHLVSLSAIDADLGRLADARASAAHAEALARDTRQPRALVAAALCLGAIALEEGRAAEATPAFERALASGRALGSDAAAANALSGLAVARAASGDPKNANALIEDARAISPDGTESAALVDARAAAVAVLLAVDEATARALRARSTQWAASSADVRIARRLTAQLDAAPAEQAGAFELVTRDGARRASGLPADADLAFDAVSRTVVVAGRDPIDLRKKPVAARLLEVVLADPGTTFEKDRLFVDVWHTPFRNASQGSALYKAVERLAHLLDDDPRRFFRWDEAGRLVLVAKRPALLRAPDGSMSTDVEE